MEKNNLENLKHAIEALNFPFALHSIENDFLGLCNYIIYEVPDGESKESFIESLDSLFSISHYGHIPEFQMEMELHNLAHLWSWNFSQTFRWVINIEDETKKREDLLSIITSFRVWLLIFVGRMQEDSERGFLIEDFYFQDLLEKISKIEDLSKKVDALEAFSLTLEYIFVTSKPQKAGLGRIYNREIAKILIDYFEEAIGSTSEGVKEYSKVLKKLLLDLQTGTNRDFLTRDILERPSLSFQRYFVSNSKAHLDQLKADRSDQQHEAPESENLSGLPGDESGSREESSPEEERPRPFKLTEDENTSAPVIKTFINLEDAASTDELFLSGDMAAEVQTEPADSSSREVDSTEKTEIRPTARYADFTLFQEEYGRKGSKVLESSPMRVENWYYLEVAIRGKVTGIPIEAGEREAIAELKNKKPVTIMVTLSSFDFEIEEPVQTITLPSSGDSSKNARFKVRAKRITTDRDYLATIKVQLFYEFNLLEEVFINAETIGFGNADISRFGLVHPITFKQSRLVRDYVDFENIIPREMHIDISTVDGGYMLNFLLWNDKDKNLAFKAPVRLTSADLEDDLLSIRETWYDIVMSDTLCISTEGDKEEFLKQIRNLAFAGNRLWIKLFRHEQGSSLFKIGEWLTDHPLTSDGIVQISLDKNAISFVFPWALIYDKVIPEQEYLLPCLEGFWGFRYVIEQKIPTVYSDTDVPRPIEDKLNLAFMLWKNFKNSESETAMMEDFRIKSKDRFSANPPILLADQCKEVLKNGNAQILYFYTHGYTRHRLEDIGGGPDFNIFTRQYEELDKDSPAHELFGPVYQSVKRKEFKPDLSWIELTLGRLYLNELYGDINELDSRPLVILNMCESAQVTPSLSESFIHFFLDRGANGVIGTECPMTIEFAHSFAQQFLTLILSGQNVGAALLETRRYFLGKNNPLGFAYTLFGSATTCYQPSLI